MATHDLNDGEAELIRLARLGAADHDARSAAQAALRSLWSESPAPASRSPRRVMLTALGAAVTVKIPVALRLDLTAERYVINVGLWVLAWVLILFSARVREAQRVWMTVGAVIAALLTFVNAFPFEPSGATLLLTAAHLPVALWFGIGVVRAHGRWREASERLDFVRFSGETFFYMAVLALAGGVLAALSYRMFASISDSTEAVIGGWLMPCGAAGTVILAAWLADGSERVMGRVALVVQRVFTPLFAVVMVAFAATAVPAGFLRTFNRDELAVYDALLIVVSALALYAVACQGTRPMHWGHDSSLLVMLMAGVAVDLLIAVSMVNRAADLGLSPNRVAATGLNLVLLANLVGLALRQWRRVRGTDSDAPSAWVAAYLPVLAGWAAFVAVVLPVAFAGR